MHSWREELAWAAGFFDGEGYVAYLITKRTSKAKQRHNKQFVLSVSQVDTSPLRRFKEAVGVGKIMGPYINNQKSSYFRYQVQSFENVQAVVAMLWSFLSNPKKRQAVEAFVNWKESNAN